MAEKPEGGGSLLANPSALLALLTVAGGLWLVSQKLTSDRPVTPAGDAREFVGDQKLVARLWEDPFRQHAHKQNGELNVDEIPAVGLNALGEQIARRFNSPRSPAPSASDPAKSVLVLPVMVSGGQYSEDQESRIRSRFAIVSALGQSGYAPEDAEHIGALRVPWLAQPQMDLAKSSSNGGKPTQLWEQDPKDVNDKKIRLLGLTPSATMEVRYEWYRPRTFSAGLRGGTTGTPPSVDFSAILVLWLDDSYFEDEPLLRLPLLLERLTDPERFPRLRVGLIGPRRSSTLRNMLPDWKTGTSRLLSPALANAGLAPLARKVLQRIDIFCATPSSMDEVLVQDPSDPDAQPRFSVREKLVESGALFKSFHNLAATDAQLAGEILDELKARQADPALPENHIVLLSEWDTFYARMLSLTYGAELAVRQKDPEKNPIAASRAAFVKAYISSDPKLAKSLPENLHSFVYLRGLDGQTVGSEGGLPVDDENHGSRRALPSSIEELRHWAPDVNKAEGQAQFDYLGRLGDRVEQLQKDLRRQSKGNITAIGIVGSDVYDTLLILQALRDRFPAVLFFTTDLDVRFFHPREREWARNLIVASSYGLELHDSLQGTVTPFRDSTQTAQFAAALAALGNARLSNLRQVPPRRFEIGNRTAVNLSVASAELKTAASNPETAAPQAWLHPLTTSEQYKLSGRHQMTRFCWGFVAVGLLAIAASWIWDPLRQLTWEGLKHTGDALDYSEEDIGGPDGAERLVQRCATYPDDEIVKWIIGESPIKDLLEKGRARTKTVGPEIDWEREKYLSDLQSGLIKQLNRLLYREGLRDETLRALPASEDAKSGSGAPFFWQQWPRADSIKQRYTTRKWLDAFLSRMSGAPEVASGEVRAQGNQTASASGAKPENLGQAALVAATRARSCACDIFRLRRQRLIRFWVSSLGVGLLACGLAWVIWRDTFAWQEGEPFSLTSGTSAWPAEVIRLAVFALALCSGFALLHQINEVFFTLTRKFRLFAPPNRVVPTVKKAKAKKHSAGAEGVCANLIWAEYQEETRPGRRMWWVIGVIAGYFFLLIAISKASGQSYTQPVRGDWNANINMALLIASILGFLALAFLTVDAATLCREFIKKLSAGATQYPEATRQYFSRQMGRIKDEYLDEWIDLELIADLTEHVGRMVYYPAGLILLLFLARNSWWDRWPWPTSLIIVFALNFGLALASVVILQRAAKNAKRLAEKSLAAKVKKLQAQTAPSVEQNNAAQAEKLLDEIRQLDRGAFVPFWENPVVGAVFLSSGGTTILQMFVWFIGR